MDKKYIKTRVLLIPAIIILVLISSAYAIETKTFSDIEQQDWFYDDVIEARQLGLVEGIGNNKYAPNSNIRYAEFLTSLVRLLDLDIEKAEEGEQWYSKYITRAIELGIIEEGEITEPLGDIPRQDVIKYTCKALGLDPATTTKIIFKDTRDVDAGYINKAYEEYLTEGMGRDTDGEKVFGFNRTSTRAELATMLLRVGEYQENPVEFKEERKEVRDKADKEYEEQKKAEEEKFEVVNGYTVLKKTEDYDMVLYVNTDMGNGDVLDISMRALWDYDESKAAVEKAISSKFGEEIGKQVGEYIWKKDAEYTEIPITKITTEDGYEICIASLNGDPYVNVGVFQPTK